jgi:hypothetical protein
MTGVLITIDTELSARLHQQSVEAAGNVTNSIFGKVAGGDYGIGWQMDRMEACGLKGVFFVDPLPALVYSPAILPDIVAPIVARGHEVQLHIHTEWLQWAKSSPVGGRTGNHIRSFAADDQAELLGLAIDMLVDAGAPRPIAFRAGNYGADDYTLAALAELGIGWDSSFNADYSDGACQITLSPDQLAPTRRQGLIEVPVSGLFDRGEHFRPAQICALSSWEMRALLNHAAQRRHPLVTIVSHSFEMLSRDRQRPNRIVMKRFEDMCRVIADHPDLRSMRFRDLDPAIADDTDLDNERLAGNLLRTAFRMTGQAAGQLLYERRQRPL